MTRTGISRGRIGFGAPLPNRKGSNQTHKNALTAAGVPVVSKCALYGAYLPGIVLAEIVPIYQEREYLFKLLLTAPDAATDAATV